MRAVVTGVGHYLPENVVTTGDVEERLRGNGFKIPSGLVQLLTGVKSRHYAADDQASSDLAAEAGRAALDRAGIDPEALDLMIFAGASHDVAEPSTAAITQSKIGCRNAATMDVKSACNSFINGVDVAASMIETGRATKVLVTTGEVITPVIDWNIESMADLRRKFAGLTLGDAGGAMVLEARQDDGEDPATASGVRAGDFMTDGEYWRLCTVLGGGSLVRNGAPEAMVFDCKSDELGALALKHLPDIFPKTLERLNWRSDEVSLVVPHQVSRSVVIELARRWDYPTERCMITVGQYGNCAAASIPLALSLAVEEGRVAKGDKIALVGGAAGFSAGVVPIVW
ncbi:3-oxoacyl-ACP synthase III family protein [Spongisporangium articulatum]|uniref:3-oxoacyl-ACP synthase III family protein n=1 Tax=Spongisporangium articulatum TaxID=3362603 RepID=A0ABW8AMQ3_9ACTN